MLNQAHCKQGIAILVLALLASCESPVGGKSTPPSEQPPAGPAFTIRQIMMVPSTSLNARSRDLSADKPWRRATDYSAIDADDTLWIVNSGENKSLIDHYDLEENFAKGLTISNPPTAATGGGIIFYLRDSETSVNVPVTYTDGVAVFATEIGKAYTVYVEIFLDGANQTEIDGQFIATDFTSTGNDELGFYLADSGCGLFVNGDSLDATYIWWPENPPAGYTGSYNLLGHNSEGRSAWRKKNFELYGGFGYVAEYLMP